MPLITMLNLREFCSKHFSILIGTILYYDKTEKSRLWNKNRTFTRAISIWNVNTPCACVKIQLYPSDFLQTFNPTKKNGGVNITANLHQQCVKERHTFNIKSSCWMSITHDDMCRVINGYTPSHYFFSRVIAHFVIRLWYFWRQTSKYFIFKFYH